MEEELTQQPSGLELLDFWAEWCGPCKIMTPIIKELEHEYKDKITIREIDVDQEEHQELVEKYRVMSVPTYIFLKDGEVVDHLVGAQSKDTMTDHLNRLVKD